MVTSQSWPDIDVSTPVLVFRAEDYGALNAIRSLGRMGVPPRPAPPAPPRSTSR